MEDGADEAIEALNGQDLQGPAIRVNEAKSKEGGDRGGRGGRSFWFPYLISLLNVACHGSL